MNIIEKFQRLGVDNAPGQESLQKNLAVVQRGPVYAGAYVDFSHGDVDAHPPTPTAKDLFDAGVEEGAAQAYTPYRGRKSLLEMLAERLSGFSGAPIDPAKNLILTSGTQGALFLAVGSCVMPGDRVAIAEPDYFANRKMAVFFNAEVAPIPLYYRDTAVGSGIDLHALEKAFQSGVKLFLFSNPNNPVGCVYAKQEIEAIAMLANRYNVTVIADELYSRQLYTDVEYTHLCALPNAPTNLITIMGPSKTESLSGYRLGVAFGTQELIDRMEKLQAIVSLRCSGYNQAVFSCWFNEPDGWLAARIQDHQRIRDDLMKIVNATPDVSARITDGGSYLFVTIPELVIPLHDFIRILRKQANVVVTPGTEFGPQFIHEFRINFSQDHDKALDALKRVFHVMEWYRA